MDIIATTGDLKTFCEQLLAEDGHEDGFITIDTEFIREKTYWPILCLIQIAGSQRTGIIDPLDQAIDLDPLFTLMQDERVLKVFHASRQDLEIFYKLTHQLPKPVFDTQVAAMVCGYGESVSYESLVNDLAQARLDKSSRFSDWSKRPLTKKQLEYALGDVIHLRVVYKKLKERLLKQDRLSWIQEEHAVLLDPKTYIMRPEEAWRRIRLAKTTGEYLIRLKEMAAFRESEAQNKNVARGRLIKDEVLSNLAVYNPTDRVSFDGIWRKIQPGLTKDLSHGLFEAIMRAQKIPENDWPQLPGRPKALSKQILQKVEFLKFLLKIKSKDHHVAEKLLATSSDIEKLALDESKADVMALHGWRFEVFGKDALSLLGGEMALALKGNQLQLIPL